MSNYIIGIDPGQKGGLALLSPAGALIEYEKMPGTRKGIYLWLGSAIYMMPASNHPCTMLVEKAQSMPSQGVSSAFSYGSHFGGFEMAALALGLRYEEVRPAIWKKAMGLNADKANAISTCERLFPSVQLIQKGCRKPHDGMAEAILIAEYGRRKGL